MTSSTGRSSDAREGHRRTRGDDAMLGHPAPRDGGVPDPTATRAAMVVERYGLGPIVGTIMDLPAWLYWPAFVLGVLMGTAAGAATVVALGTDTAALLTAALVGLGLYAAALLVAFAGWRIGSRSDRSPAE